MIIARTKDIIDYFLKQDHYISDVKWECGVLSVYIKDMGRRFYMDDFIDGSPTKELLNGLVYQLENLPIKRDDTIISSSGHKYKVGSVEFDSCYWVCPEGADEYTYWIPFSSVVEVIRDLPESKGSNQ